MSIECYVCRRTEQDLDYFHGPIEAMFRQEIDHAIAALGEAEARVGAENAPALQLLSQIPPEFLEFSIGTIKTDRQTFGKHIPNLEEVVRTFDAKDPHSNSRKLSGIMASLLPQNIPELINLRQRVEQLRQSLTSALESHEHFQTFRVYALSGGPFVDVQLCVACAQLMKQSAEAVFGQKQEQGYF